MNLEEALTDEAVLTELGARLAKRRVAMRLKQADLAQRAGVGKRTLERIEAGESCQLSSWVRVLRELELLPALDAALPADATRPMALLGHRERMPTRVRDRREDDEPDGAEWRWDDEA